MNCWKSFNITRDLGFIRLAIFSLLGVIGFYILFYMSLSNGSLSKPQYFHPTLFFAALFAVVPFHQLLHAIPAWIVRKRIKLKMDKGHWYPKLRLVMAGPISKQLFMVMTLMPVIAITTISLVVTVTVPGTISYFSAVGALNFGLCIADIMYFVQVVGAPTNALIEDDTDSCKILIRKV